MDRSAKCSAKNTVDILIIILWYDKKKKATYSYERSYFWSKYLAMTCPEYSLAQGREHNTSLYDKKVELK